MKFLLLLVLSIPPSGAQMPGTAGLAGFGRKLMTLNYWGTGADGALSTTGNVNVCDSTTDGEMCVMNYSSLTINAGHTLTTTVRRKGLIVYVSGDAVINGTLSMTARGANVDPVAAGVPAGGLTIARRTYAGGSAAASVMTGAGANVIAAEAAQTGCSGTCTSFAIARAGGAGGGSVTIGANVSGGVAANPGQNGGVGQSGGGAGGAAVNGPGWPSASTSGAGSAGTCFSGGSGGGASVQRTSAGSAGANGGAGGAANAFNDTGSGGAGNPGGAGSAGGSAGNTGTGGLLILIVKGSLTIGATGVIASNGSDSGAGGVRGGGSGGGIVLVLHAGSLTNSGNVTATGGSGSGGYGYGRSGGDGSVRIEQILP